MRLADLRKQAGHASRGVGVVAVREGCGIVAGFNLPLVLRDCVEARQQCQHLWAAPFSSLDECQRGDPTARQYYIAQTSIPCTLNAGHPVWSRDLDRTAYEVVQFTGAF